MIVVLKFDKRGTCLIKFGQDILSLRHVLSRMKLDLMGYVRSDSGSLKSDTKHYRRGYKLGLRQFYEMTVSVFFFSCHVCSNKVTSLGRVF